MHFFVPDVKGDVFRFVFVPHVHKHFPYSTKYRDPGSISSSYLCRMQTYCGPFVCPSIKKHKIKCWSKWQPSYRSVLHFSLAPLVFLYFGSHFRIVIFLRRNRSPDTMLYIAVVAKTAVTSEFDLSCKPLSAQRACMANTRDAPTNLMSEVCMEQCTLCSFYFRWLPVYYTMCDLYILCYQQYSMIPGTKGQSTFHLIRYTYVSGTCMYVMNTSHTWRPAPDFSIHALQVVRIFCRTVR